MRKKFKTRRRGGDPVVTGALTRQQRLWFVNHFAALEAPEKFFPGGADAARAIWEARRDEFTAEYRERNPGRMPPGWWYFESPEPITHLDDEVAQLKGMGYAWR